MPRKKKGTKKGMKGGSTGTVYSGDNKYDKDWPPPVNVPVKPID